MTVTETLARKTRDGVPFREVVERALLAYATPMSHETTGTRSASIGAGLENLIAVTNKRYEQLGFGCVIKNELRRSVINGRLIFKQKQTVDFGGYLAEIGFVAFDAKTTRETNWSPANQALHQLCYLLRGQREMRTQYGEDRRVWRGRFFYLLEHRELDTSRGALAEKSTVYLVEDLEALVDRGRYEFREEDRMGCGEQGVLLDYRAKLLGEAPYAKYVTRARRPAQ